MKTTISSRGQIVLPAEFRQLDRIETGQEFDVERLDPGDYRLVRRPVAFSAGAVDWLLACPAKGYFVPVASESTDTHDLADQDRGDGTGARPDHGHPQSAGLREGRPGHR